MQPIELTVDFEAKAAYIRYRALLPNEHVAETRDLSPADEGGDGDGSVAVDLDAYERVIGIEILAFDPETLLIAKTFAAGNGLEFPQNLAGVLTAPATATEPALT